ncbi:hypothetical protein AMELA_G00189000 [Ameiurus melas]|uniref:Uncharacterized protein n=1 Tax=Ameiurus melas TaxID=219545 RepID=A0A7J6AAQ1_AMEME|nr:hypothetical protein AMELA_G00189000 [Ameiurus melas]
MPPDSHHRAYGNYCLTGKEVKVADHCVRKPGIWGAVGDYIIKNANAWIPLTNPLLLLSLVCGECTARAQPRNGVGEQERRKKSNRGRDRPGLRLKLKLA